MANGQSKILSKIYQTLSADAQIVSIVGGRIRVQEHKPEDVANPCLLIFPISAIESNNFKEVTDTMFRVVCRSKTGDSEGSELDNLFNRCDELLNEQYFLRDGFGGRLTRRGISVFPGLYDPESKDYFKQWSYRAIIKYIGL